MVNEKRLIELDHALQAVAEQYTTDTTERELSMFCDIRQRLRTLPTVDAVEVVRCKDCKYCRYDSEDCFYACVCHDAIDDIVSGDDFCSYGAKMDGDGNA